MVDRGFAGADPALYAGNFGLGKNHRVRKGEYSLFLRDQRLRQVHASEGPAAFRPEKTFAWPIGRQRLFYLHDGQLPTTQYYRARGFTVGELLD